MPDEMRSKPVQRIQFAPRKKTPIGEHGKKRLRTVPFALNVMVVLRASESFRTDPHDAIVKHVQDIDTGEISSGMPCTAGFDDAQKGSAVLDRFMLELALI